MLRARKRLKALFAHRMIEIVKRQTVKHGLKRLLLFIHIRLLDPKQVLGRVDHNVVIGHEVMQ